MIPEPVKPEPAPVPQPMSLFTDLDSTRLAQLISMATPNPNTPLMNIVNAGGLNPGGLNPFGY